MSAVESAAHQTPARAVPVVWGSVPQRNKNFTGRDSLLTELRRRVTGDITAVLPHALQGLGGVGKTQLAIEYAYRYAGDYQVVWWLPADQPQLVRSALAALAPRLGLTSIAPGRIEDAVAAVLDALRRGEPYDRWLLIFDNADQPEMIRDLMPHGGGQVLVTSRNHRWHSMADTVEVNVFSRQESLDFLHRRVSGINDRDAGRLAEELGDLPLALEQAGALQAETGMSVEDYLGLLAREAGKLLAENPPSDYPVPVAAAWSLSVARLREQMPFAMELLRRCAFFGPEPIHRDLLNRGRYVLDSPLRESLADPITVSRATRELGRYALARIDNNRNTLQVHRLIQKLIRDELTDAETEKIQGEVHRLLAAADPTDPDVLERWDEYEALMPHIGPSDVVASDQPEVRRLVGNIVRYLFNIGDTRGSLAEADRALESWTPVSGESDPSVLSMSRRKADALWALGRFEEAYELRRDTLTKMRDVLGENDEETLLVTNGHGADLRSRGDFRGALELDEASWARHRDVFGEEHIETFAAANNLAADLELTSDYQAARALDDKNYRDRRDFYGRDDHPLVVFSLNSLARDTRQIGDYIGARAYTEQAWERYQDITRLRVLPTNHAWVLLNAKDLSVVLRMTGDFRGALELAEDVYARYRRDFTDNHPDTLAAAINLGNALRRVARLSESAEILAETVEGYRKILGPEHPYTYASVLNLAVVRRQIGRDDDDLSLLEDSRDRLEETLAGLIATVGPNHHYALTCTTSLASALADLGDVTRARAMEEESLPRIQAVLGDDHPHALMCAANLALDLRALGRVEEADELAADVQVRYAARLGEDHPDVREVREGIRVDFVFEPSPF
ncbi:MAG: FxSxx-COOH system tetratricopeptide repeat protein [Frankia sp.]